MIDIILNYKQIVDMNCQDWYIIQQKQGEWPILKVGHIRYQVIMFERVNQMILSVSRRKDIPNYYSEWFYNRIK